MSTKEIVRDLMEKLPEDVSLHEVARQIEFVAAVHEGMAEAEAGDVVPLEDVEREMPSWIIK